jgi:hypothetical protein
LHLPNLELRQHNILEDSLDALGPGSFDLVSLRLMLFWLAGKQELAIGRMVECLRPGGWLVDEDGDWGTIAPVDPSHSCSAYHGAYRAGKWSTARGYDPTFGRKLSVLFERCGLENIRLEVMLKSLAGAARSHDGGSQQTLEAIRGWELADHGLTEAREEEYKVLIAPWTDQSFWFLTALVYACWGQRPEHKPASSNS